MSRENVELLRSLYERFNAGDLSVPDVIADDFELHDPDLPGGGVFHGPGGLRAYLRQFDEAWDDYRLEIEDAKELDDRVIVLLREVGRGKGSRALTELRGAHVWTVKDGRPVRLCTYLDHSSALEAVGLRE